MIKLNDRMTPAELAELTGYKRQTINRWVRQQNWETVKLAGVKGGKAHVIIVDERVREFLFSTSGVYQSQASDNHSDALKMLEITPGYNAEKTSLARQLVSAIGIMTQLEQQQLSQILLREGVAGILQRLGITDSSDRQQ